MAPAIVHFLIGATLLLTAAVPVVLRYGIDRENAIWLIPLGGIWGLIPDVHNITLSKPTRIAPLSTAIVGCLISIFVWLIAVPVPFGVVTESGLPLLHFGSLIAVVNYGIVFGAAYGMVRGAFSSRSSVQLGIKSLSG